MDEQEFLAGQFEEHRGRLRAVAYRMLGSLSEADDAVQEAWLRLSRADAGEVRNLGGWLTTVVGRVCLDLLRSRAARGERPLEFRVPDPVVGPPDGTDPEQQALLADSVGLALLVVLETLAPAERLAFVLHDLFALPFEEIAPVVGRSPAAARQLASRARRRVRGTPAAADPDAARQREVVDAFMAATQRGDFEALLALLDPDVVMRVDTGSLLPAAPGAGASAVIRGADAVAGRVVQFQRFAHYTRPVLVNGVPGLVNAPAGRVASIMGFTVVGGRIAQIQVLADAQRVERLDIGLDVDAG
jgi:RNA polymerase sigma factor (sigma-70 family)